MKNSFVKILCAAITVLSATVSAEAKRPVWVIAHGGNWKNSIEEALNQGANGVEIDVREGTTLWNFFNWHSTNGKHWCLGHDTYYPKEKCDKDNPKAVSLEWVLTGKVTNGYTTKINDDPRFCVLWLDVKDEGYLKELVDYVHSFIKRNSDLNYSIIYNIYHPSKLDKKVEDGKDNYIPLKQWLRRELYIGEYINLANETITTMKKHVGSEWPKITEYHHFYTMGVFNVDQPQNTSKSKRENLSSAISNRAGFCKKVGVWSNVTANNAEAWINFGVDVVLTYYSHGYIPTPECKTTALPELVSRIRSGKDNLSEVYIATRKDDF